ncbi:hypothetical protein ACQPU1_07350 [Clostridium paraputrificum]|uniref:hypothetical protein n=1 Tax=Clostridium paraputrificum TaxID=29363 RepID=UPI003D333C41
MSNKMKGIIAGVVVLLCVLLIGFYIKYSNNNELKEGISYRKVTEASMFKEGEVVYFDSGNDEYERVFKILEIKRNTKVEEGYLAKNAMKIESINSKDITWIDVDEELRKSLAEYGTPYFVKVSDSSNEKGQEFFNAVVLEVQENYLLVEPIEGEDELKSSDRIKVTKDIVSKAGVPDVKVGDEIRIVYNGEIMESYPARLGVVYAIYRADELE